jgi:hypothetical protein
VISYLIDTDAASKIGVFELANIKFHLLDRDNSKSASYSMGVPYSTQTGFRTVSPHITKSVTSSEGIVTNQIPRNVPEYQYSYLIFNKLEFPKHSKMPVN